MPQPLSYEELEKRVIELEAQVAQYKIAASSNINSVLLDIFRHITRFNTFKQTAGYIFEQCKKLTGAKSGYIALLSDDGKENEVLFLDAGGMPCDVDPELPMPVRGLRAVAYETRQVAYDNAFADSPWIKFMPKGHVRLDNVLFAPLNLENKTAGVIGLANKPGGFHHQDVYMARMLGDIAALALTYSRFQESLKENEKRYQAILKTTMDGFWLTDQEGQLLEVNDTYCRMSGYTKEELLSLKIMDLEAFEDSSLVADHTRRIIEKRHDRFETRHRRKDGSVYDVEVSAHFFQEESGHFICFLRDITEKNKAFEAIKTSAEKMKLAADSAHFGIWDLDIRANRLVWDERMFNLYGIHPDEFEGTYEDWIKSVHPDDIEQSREDVAQAIKGEKKFDTAFRIIRPDGTIRHIKAYADITRDKRGKAVHITGINYDITDQRTAETALRESEERFRLAFMMSPDAININRLEDGMYLDINEGFTRIMGYKRDEVLGNTSSALNIWKLTEDRERLVEGLRANGFVDNLEAEFISKAGRTRYGLMSARILLLNNETVILSITRDITERKKMEEALGRSEKKWRNILKNTPQIGISLNPDAEITFANEHFLDLTGWKRDEILGRNWFDLFIPENVRERVREVFHAVMGQKDTTGLSTYENEIIGKSGDIFNIAWSNVLTKNPDGGVMDVTCLGVDLTERRRSEERLRKSEARYRTMIEAIKDPVYICSEDYRIQYMNQAMIDRVGHDATGELCFNALHGFDQKCLWCKYDEIFKHGHTEKDIVSPKDNRSYNVSSTVFINEDGSSSKISVFRDTTDFIALQGRLQQAQKMEAIGNLAGGIAHDFNNILFPIIGMSELILEDVEPDSLVYENTREIHKAGNRAKDLVSQILSFSHQTGHEMMPVKFQNVLKEVLKLCRSSIPTNIEIEREIQQDCGSIWANATQLHQIGMNLITNAYHAVQDKNGKIRITLKEVRVETDHLSPLSLRPGKYAQLSVSDNGTGMPEAIVHKIFEPYFTTKEKGKGTGLGLAVVYGIVKESKGDIQVISEPGSGTTFNIYLPLIKKSGYAEFGQSDLDIQTGHERILLVDDEVAIAQLVKLMLERLGYTVTMAVTSPDALNTFKRYPDNFDMVISDMSMPGMTGDQLAYEIRQIRPDIPIIICTGFSERINKETAEQIGVNGFLMKPITKSELARTIRMVFDQNSTWPLTS